MTFCHLTPRSKSRRSASGALARAVERERYAAQDTGTHRLLSTRWRRSNSSEAVPQEGSESERMSGRLVRMPARRAASTRPTKGDIHEPMAEEGRSGRADPGAWVWRPRRHRADPG